MEFTRDKTGQLEPCLSDRFPFHVETCKGAGRCLRANRGIAPESTVLSDTAVFLGPASAAVCIVCCSNGDDHHCEGCGHVLCRLCAGDGGHTLNECTVLRTAGYHDDMYNVILPVRFAMMKQRDGEMFEWLMMYMNHNEERDKRSEALAKSVDRMSIIVAECVEGISKCEAKSIVGILLTNCFELKAFGKEARALYPLVSLLNHSCVPNLRHTNLIAEVSDGTQEGGIVVMKLESQRAIASGSELTIRYNNYMEGYLQRQRFLLNEFHFVCHCPRCRDPTEFGTFTSSIPCPHCQTGFTLCSPRSVWVCSSCSSKINRSIIAAREEEVMVMIREHDSSTDSRNIKVVLTLLNKVQKLLHKNHFIVMALKQKFLFTFSMSLKKTRDMGLEQCAKLYPLLTAQETFSRQLLNYHEILDPGRSQLKTKFLFELKKVLLIQSKFLSESNKDRLELIDKLNEVRALTLSLSIASVIPL